MRKEKVVQELKIVAIKEIVPACDGIPLRFPMSKNKIIDKNIDDTKSIILMPGKIYCLILDEVSTDISGVSDMRIEAMKDLQMIGTHPDITVEGPNENRKLMPFMTLVCASEVLLDIEDAVPAVVILIYDSEKENDVIFDGKLLDGTVVKKDNEKEAESTVDPEKDNKVLNAFEKKYNEQVASMPQPTGAGSIMEDK